MCKRSSLRMNLTRKAAALFSVAPLLLFLDVWLNADNIRSGETVSTECIRLAKRRCVVVENNRHTARESILGVLADLESYRGTGVIIQKNLVLTNTHILRPDSEILIDGKVATVVRKSDEHDLTLLAVETEKLPKITIDELEDAGERVFYVSNPGRREDVVIHGMIVEIDDQFIYTDGFEDIETSMGASGSGLYSKQGHLIGLKKGMLSEESDPRCLSVSIPATRIKKFLRELIVEDFSLDYL
jgi:S1-C subfamily serine protease